MVEYDTIETLNDTQFVPIVEKAMAPADIEFRLDVFFDVSGAGMASIAHMSIFASSHSVSVLRRFCFDEDEDDAVAAASVFPTALLWTSVLPN
jgi:hypothetical protein